MDGGVERLLKDRGKGARAGKKPISAEVRLAIVKRTAQEKPQARNALERTHVGRGDRRRPHDGATRLEGAWPQAASDTPIQAIERSKIR